VSKNEAVCHEVQTHFGSFLCASFMKVAMGAFSRFMRPIMKLFAVEFQSHFASSPHSRFTKKFLDAFSRFLRPKTKLFAVEFRCILEVLCLQSLQNKLWAHFLDLCV